MLQVTNLFSEMLLGNFALEDINLTQQTSENLAIIGETGSGKSTLLKIIAGLIQPKSGEIVFKNKKVKGPDWQLVAGEEGIAYLSQHFELRNNYRMEELLQYANELPNDEANEIFATCKIEHLMKRNSYELSGGEKQRVAFARLLISKPRLLILDEPYSNLDFIHKKILKQVIKNGCKKYSISCILASHEPTDIMPWADKIIVLKAGKIIQQGTANEVFYNPINDYIAALLGSYNYLSAAVSAKFGFNKSFIRPSQFIISINENEGLRATVIATNFLGNYYEVELVFFDENITVISQINFKIGDIVYLAIKNVNSIK